VADLWCEPLVEGMLEGICQARVQAGEPCVLGSGGDPCHGRGELSPDSLDPAIGTCMDVPALCLYEELRPPV
jgi:hypothetical protein